MAPRLLKPGVYCPIPSFFQDGSEDLGASLLSLVGSAIAHCHASDLEAFEKHVILVAQAGVGPLLAGSNGEAIHLAHDERATLIKAARRVLDSSGFEHVPVIAGTGAGSTRETILLCKAAAEAGADYVVVARLVLCSRYAFDVVQEAINAQRGS